MKPIRSRRSRVSSVSRRIEILRPPTKTAPEVAVSRPDRMCIMVDLPEPDGPMMAVNSASPKSTVTSSSARTSVSPLP